MAEPAAEEAAQGGKARRTGASADPVFVLCGGRSGSTLLRFVLDAHPDLACPPETNVPALCGQLATVWSLIAGAPLSANRGDEPPEIPEAAIAGVRETMDRMVGSYLERRGKKRYCDKSLGTARFAYLVTRVWPEAKFICLFRHPMDVIASGIEACPWGLNGYGFDPYIAETPGNVVFALARFWADNVVTILAAEEEYGDRSLRVRYEDLVSDPEAVANEIFDFLGVARVPGIAEAIFADERERFGPADYKIWNTSRITTDSMGRGWSIPAGLIGSQVREAVNELAGRLGYIPVDDSWGTADPPADLRLTTESEQDGEKADVEASPLSAMTQDRGDSPVPGFASSIGKQLEAALTRVDDAFARRWRPCANESFSLIATPPAGVALAGYGVARWQVDLTARTVTAVDGGDGHLSAKVNAGDGVARSRPASDDEDSSGEAEAAGGWDIIGSADTWEQVIGGRTNLAVVLRRNQLRYCATGHDGPVVADTRMGMLADLLGLTGWGKAHPTLLAAADVDTP
jgi:hypothetical protein